MASTQRTLLQEALASRQSTNRVRRPTEGGNGELNSDGGNGELKSKTEPTETEQPTINLSEARLGVTAEPKTEQPETSPAEIDLADTSLTATVPADAVQTTDTVQAEGEQEVELDRSETEPAKPEPIDLDAVVAKEVEELDFTATASRTPLPVPDLADQVLERTIATGHLPRKFNPPESLEQVQDLLIELERPFLNAEKLDENIKEVKAAIEEASLETRAALLEWDDHQLRQDNPISRTFAWEREVKQRYLKAISQELGFPVFEASPYGSMILKEGPICRDPSRIKYPVSFRVISPDGGSCKILLRGEVTYLDGIGTRKIPKFKIENYPDPKLSQTGLKVNNPFWGLSPKDEKIAATFASARELSVEKLRDALRFTREEHRNQLRLSQGLFFEKGNEAHFLSEGLAIKARAIRDQVLAEITPPTDGNHELGDFLYNHYKLLASERERRVFPYPDRHYDSFMRYLEYAVDTDVYATELAITPFKFEGSTAECFAVTLGDKNDPDEFHDLVLEVQADGTYAGLVSVPATQGRKFGFYMVRYNDRHVHYQRIGDTFGMLPPGTICTESGVPIYSKREQLATLFQVAKSHGGMILNIDLDLPVRERRRDRERRRGGRKGYLNISDAPKPRTWGQTFLNNQIQSTEFRWQLAVGDRACTHIDDTTPRIIPEAILSADKDTEYTAYCFPEYSILEPDYTGEATYIVRTEALDRIMDLGVKVDVREHPGFVTTFIHSGDSGRSQTLWGKKIGVFLGNPQLLTDGQKFLADRVEQTKGDWERYLKQNGITAESAPSRVTPVVFMKRAQVGLAYRFGEIAIVEMNSQSAATYVVKADSITGQYQIPLRQMDKQDFFIESVTHYETKRSPANIGRWEREVGEFTHFAPVEDKTLDTEDVSDVEPNVIKATGEALPTGMHLLSDQPKDEAEEAPAATKVPDVDLEKALAEEEEAQRDIPVEVLQQMLMDE